MRVINENDNVGDHLLVVISLVGGSHADETTEERV